MTTPAGVGYGVQCSLNFACTRGGIYYFRCISVCQHLNREDSRFDPLQRDKICGTSICAARTILHNLPGFICHGDQRGFYPLCGVWGGAPAYPPIHTVDHGFGRNYIY